MSRVILVVSNREDESLRLKGDDLAINPEVKIIGSMTFIFHSRRTDEDLKNESNRFGGLLR